MTIETHYEWELQDANGEYEWAAGGSGNDLADVKREGQRYLSIYSQDGPHKLLIYKHQIELIEELSLG